MFFIPNSDKIEYYLLKGTDISHGGLFQRILLIRTYRVPQVIWGTPIYAGYLELLWSYAGYLELCRVPRVIPGTLNYAGVILCTLNYAGVILGTSNYTGYLNLYGIS